MPTETPFKALGLKNGFPNYISQDVTDYDSWTTLSGWSKTNQPSTQSAQLASIEESRRLAMLLFWNLSEVTGTLNTSSNEHGASSLNSSGITGQPKNRVHLSSIANFAEDGDEYPTLGSHSQLGTFSNGFKIAELYNNSVFVGYGVDYGFQARTDAAAYLMRVDSRVQLRSYYSYTVNQYEDRAYVNLTINNNTFYLVCTARVYTQSWHSTGTTTVNKNAANLLAEGTASRKFPLENGEYGPLTQVATSKAQINSLNFYTY